MLLWTAVLLSRLLLACAGQSPSLEDCGGPSCRERLVAEPPEVGCQGSGMGGCRARVLAPPDTPVQLLPDPQELRQTTQEERDRQARPRSLWERVELLEGSVSALQSRVQGLGEEEGRLDTLLALVLAVLGECDLDCRSQAVKHISQMAGQWGTSQTAREDLLQLLRGAGLTGTPDTLREHKSDGATSQTVQSAGGEGEEEEEEEEGSQYPRDCAEIYKQGIRENGIYTIQPTPDKQPFEASCDMLTAGGGWTVFQRRQDGSVDFNRTWQEYRQGFGPLQGEHWLGNEALHSLTRAGHSLLRIELQDWYEVQRHATYRRFRVAHETHRYRLTAREYTGDAGNALSYSKHYNHDGRPFSTADSDNDSYPSGSCGSYYGAGWWFDSCLAANLNGRYHRGRYSGLTDGIYWGTWYILTDRRSRQKYSFKRVEMKTRPVDF
ncbi:ficolin-2-like [Acipenser oxyrinchus oxyrinchus]|uniref:Ficolin-2-like n=1 Tax=Acipenser oxyrinchus oxyrinchus TaxID=40147 RepID=A0AAD8CX96_ACIOX|nr:ficolin-2-like [Acipenser oxyrinchus oxyrinchus]